MKSLGCTEDTHFAYTKIGNDLGPNTIGAQFLGTAICRRYRQPWVVRDVRACGEYHHPALHHPEAEASHCHFQILPPSRFSAATQIWNCESPVRLQAGCERGHVQGTGLRDSHRPAPWPCAGVFQTGSRYATSLNSPKSVCTSCSLSR